jgi:hypothetical protein
VQREEMALAQPATGVAEWVDVTRFARVTGLAPFDRDSYSPRDERRPPS